MFCNACFTPFTPLQKPFFTILPILASLAFDLLFKMSFVLDLNPLRVLLFIEKNLQTYPSHTMKPESESKQNEAQIYSENNS